METTPIAIEHLTNGQVELLLAMGLTHGSSPRGASVELCRSVLEDPSKRQRQMLLADLQAPLAAPASGPLSFARLTGVSETEAARLEGRSLLDLLLSQRTNAQLLEKLAEYGRLLSLPELPEPTRLTGAVVRSLAVAALVQRHAQRVSSADVLAAGDVLAALASTHDMPQSVRDHAASSSQYLRPIKYWELGKDGK